MVGLDLYRDFVDLLRLMIIHELYEVEKDCSMYENLDSKELKNLKGMKKKQRRR